MSSLRTLGVSFAFRDDVPLFSNVSFHLAAGWTGLIGANGAGKSTLLEILAGLRQPDRGSVQLEPRGARVTLCPQRIEELSVDIEAFAWDPDRIAYRLRVQLKLDPSSLDRWPTLSPGERKRWQIGAALASEPDVLLLDEPTNHLDAEARALLVAALGRFNGIGILVSHDRMLLDAVTTTTVRLARSQTFVYGGSYTEAREVWLAAERETIAAHEKAKDRLKNADRKLDDARRAQASADHNRSTRARLKDKNDHDGRSAGAKTRANWAEARAGRAVTTQRADRDRARELVTVFEADKTAGRSVAFAAKASAKSIAAFSAEEIVRGEKVLLRSVSLRLWSEDRVHLAGPNGSGKSTLLALIAEQARDALYLPQEIDAEEGSALLAKIRELSKEERGAVLSQAAALGLDVPRVMASETPSPGEARKLMMAFGLGREVSALLLDEPTNHLDLPSIERLQAALQSFSGAIVLITHDEELAAGVTLQRWRLEARTVLVE